MPVVGPNDYQRDRSDRALRSCLITSVVGLAIIGTLGGMLLSVFAHAHENARKATCQSSLHELGIALSTYIGDFDNKLPSSALVRHSKQWNRSDFLAYGTWTGTLPPVGRPQTYVGALYVYYKSRDIVCCPSDPAQQGISHSNKPASYCWKIAADKAWYGEGCKEPRQSESDFGYNQDQIILYERQAFHSDDQPGLVNGTQINVTFLDSHVKNITIKNATKGSPMNCAGNADGEPMYFNWDYENNRGLDDDQAAARYLDPMVYGDKF